MYRRIVLSSNKLLDGVFWVLYHAHGVKLLSQARVSDVPFDVNSVNNSVFAINVFLDSARVNVSTYVGEYRTYEFILDIQENQPNLESVEEISDTGVKISVYNENGVLVCSSQKSVSGDKNPSQVGSPGESIGGTGDMTSEPIDDTGEMASEPIDSLNTTI